MSRQVIICSEHTWAYNFADVRSLLRIFKEQKMNFLLFFCLLTRIGADEFARGPRPRPIVAKPSCPKWGTEIDGYCLWKGSHFPVKREVADELCQRSGGHVFLPVEKPKNLLLQVTSFTARKNTDLRESTGEQVYLLAAPFG